MTKDKKRKAGKQTGGKGAGQTKRPGKPAKKHFSEKPLLWKYPKKDK